jgi:hypothetical protein
VRTSSSTTPPIHSKALEATRSLQVAAEKHNLEARIHSGSTDHQIMQSTEAPRTMKVAEARQTIGARYSSRTPMMVDASGSRGQPGSSTARRILRTPERAEAMERRLQREPRTSQGTSNTQADKGRLQTIKDSRMRRAPRARNLNSLQGRECLQARWATLALMGRVPSIHRS